MLETRDFLPQPKMLDQHAQLAAVTGLFESRAQICEAVESLGFDSSKLYAYVKTNPVFEGFRQVENVLYGGDGIGAGEIETSKVPDDVSMGAVIYQKIVDGGAVCLSGPATPTLILADADADADCMPIEPDYFFIQIRIG